MRRSEIDKLASYIESYHPIIYINHFDFHVIDEAIRQAAGGAQCIEFNNALGCVDFESKRSLQPCDLENFLMDNREEGFDQPTILILKDVHEDLCSPKIIALLRWIAEKNLYQEDYNEAVLILSDVLVVPRELENYITVFDIPLPTVNEIETIIHDFCSDMELDVQPDVIKGLALSFKGMSEFQIKQILNLAYQDGGSIDSDDKTLILHEKEQLIKKSGLLELINFSETIDDIGGLECLKNWLKRKAKIFSQLEKAVSFGVDIPKGVMIVGMPGCGKSLTAKATASLFRMPLVRLDVGRLLGKYVGESENNMRRALKLAEAISPCVLWVDEIEKAFSGVGTSGGGSDVTTRLFGQFLTWMQEKESSVFIVATANDISNIPMEFLRKGRFDELFFVDLPNDSERKKILEIHLKKRKKWDRAEIALSAVVKETKGFSGADVEAVAKDAIENAFVDGQKDVTTAGLLKAARETKSITDTQREKLEKIRAAVQKMDIKRASAPD